MSIYPTNIPLSTASSFGLIKVLLHITALLAVDLGMGLPIRIQEKVTQVALSPGPKKIPSPPLALPPPAMVALEAQVGPRGHPFKAEEGHRV